MDMWDPYIDSTRDHFDQADDKIVFYRYHLMKYMTGAVDTVRKQEIRALVVGGDKSLSGTKYLWLAPRCFVWVDPPALTLPDIVSAQVVGLPLRTRVGGAAPAGVGPSALLDEQTVADPEQGQLAGGQRGRFASLVTPRCRDGASGFAGAEGTDGYPASVWTGTGASMP